MEVTLWASYTLLCAPSSAFITRGSRGPANLAMALGEEATPCKDGALGYPRAHPGPTPPWNGWGLFHPAHQSPQSQEPVLPQRQREAHVGPRVYQLSVWAETQELHY